MGNNSERFVLGGRFHVNQYNTDGELVDSWEVHNIITDQGVNHTLDVALANGTQVSTWYVGLKGSGAVAASNTAAGIGTTNSWSEIVEYTEANRQTWTVSSPSNKTVTNESNRASFSINDTVSVHGAFLISDNTKTGTSGTLYAVANFDSSKSLSNGDTLEITYALSGDDDGV